MKAKTSGSTVSSCVHTALLIIIVACAIILSTSITACAWIYANYPHYAVVNVDGTSMIGNVEPMHMQTVIASWTAWISAAIAIIGIVATRALNYFGFYKR